MDERELLEAGVRKDSFISCICTIMGFRIPIWGRVL
jgi:hypothetical protein